MASTLSSPQRLPFGELGSAQLQRLSATKNVQNAVTAAIASSKGFAGKSNVTTPAKRPLTPTIFEDDFEHDADTENVDPVLSFSKRSKGVDGAPIRKPTLSPLNLNFGSQTAFTSASSNVTLTSPSLPKVPIQQAASAPAGRSPKHKRIGILSRKRVSSSSPFRRIDPPVFGAVKGRVTTGSSGSAPLSLDEALKGTLSSYKAASTSKAPLIEESMPKSWQFAIHEDTADEEAANLMEHCTYNLDISDDENSSSKNQDDRGKENIPPADHIASERVAPAKERASANPDSMVDIRSPLGSLEAKDFYGKGLDASSVEIIAAEVEAEVKEEDAPKVESSKEDKPVGETAAEEFKIAEDTAIAC